MLRTTRSFNAANGSGECSITTIVQPHEGFDRVFGLQGLSQFVKKKLLSSALFGSRCKQEIRLLDYNRPLSWDAFGPGP